MVHGRLARFDTASWVCWLVVNGKWGKEEAHDSMEDLLTQWKICTKIKAPTKHKEDLYKKKHTQKNIMPEYSQIVFVPFSKFVWVCI